jgi:glutamyl-tRNA reductase
LFDVAAGIDSPILGEGEILRQVREAAEVARAEHATGTVLEPLFRHAVEAGKRARAETGIARGTTSLAHAAVALAAEHAGGLEGKKIVVVGAGEMGAGVARALAGRGDLTGEVVVANRGADRAAEVADVLAARAIDLDALPSELEDADIVMTSTAADGIVLGVSMFAAALASRPSPRRVVVIDIAMPRDVDPAVGLLAGVTRLDVEDIRRYAEEQMSSRTSEVPRVKELLAEELDRYRASAAGRLAAPVVAALRDRAETIRVAELEHHAAKLESLSPAEREIVEVVTRRVIAKLLHEPTVRVKEVAGSPRGERLAEALRVLFDL